MIYELTLFDLLLDIVITSSFIGYLGYRLIKIHKVLNIIWENQTLIGRRLDYIDDKISLLDDNYTFMNKAMKENHTEILRESRYNQNLTSAYLSGITDKKKSDKKKY